MGVLNKIRNQISSYLGLKTVVYKNMGGFSSNIKSVQKIGNDIDTLKQHYVVSTAYKAISNLVFGETPLVYGSKYVELFNQLYKDAGLEELLKVALSELILGTGNALVFFRDNKPFLYPFLHDRQELRLIIDPLTRAVIGFENSLNSDIRFNLSRDQVYWLKDNNHIYDNLGMSPLVRSQHLIRLHNAEVTSALNIAQTGHKDLLVGSFEFPETTENALENSQIFLEDVRNANLQAMAKAQENGGVLLLSGMSTPHSIKQYQFRYKETLDAINSQIALAFGLSPSYLGIGNSANFKNEQDRENTIESLVKDYQSILAKLANYVLGELSPLYKELANKGEVEIYFGNPETKAIANKQERLKNLLVELYLPNKSYFDGIGYKIDTAELENLGLIKKESYDTST